MWALGEKSIPSRFPLKAPVLASGLWLLPQNLGVGAGGRDVPNISLPVPSVPCLHRLLSPSASPSPVLPQFFPHCLLPLSPMSVSFSPNFVSAINSLSSPLSLHLSPFSLSLPHFSLILSLQTPHVSPFSSCLSPSMSQTLFPLCDLGFFPLCCQWGKLKGTVGGGPRGPVWGASAQAWSPTWQPLSNLGRPFPLSGLESTQVTSSGREELGKEAAGRQGLHTGWMSLFVPLRKGCMVTFACFCPCMT